MKIIRPFIILIFFVAFAVIHLAIYTDIIKVGYEIDSSKRSLEKLRVENRYLNYLVAKDEALPRVESIARAKINMVYPEKMNYITIASDEASSLH